MTQLKTALIALTAVFSVNICDSVAQQTYKPTTLWPYVNSDFSQGTIYQSGGRATDATLNVHLMSGELHSLKGDNISAVTLTEIDSVRIGSTTFIKTDGCMCEVLGHSGRVFVVKKVIGDFNKLMSGTGAYGTTLSTSGRRELTSLEIGGINQTNHGLLRQNREQSQILPVKTSRLVVITSADAKAAPQIVDCTSRSVKEIIPAEKQDEWKAAVKVAKIKWSKDESVGGIAALVDKFIQE